MSPVGVWVCVSRLSNIFSSETTRPITEAKYHMEPPWGGERKFVQMVQVMTKVCPSCPYMVKTLKIFFFGTKKPMTLKIGMQHRALKFYQVYSNDDLGLTLTYFTARSNLVPYAFVWEKGKTVAFSKTIVVYDIKVGRRSQLNEYMNLYKYQRSRAFIDSTFSNFFSSETLGRLKTHFIWSLHGMLG